MRKKPFTIYLPEDLITAIKIEATMQKSNTTDLCIAILLTDSDLADRLTWVQNQPQFEEVSSSETLASLDS